MFKNAILNAIAAVIVPVGNFGLKSYSWYQEKVKQRDQYLANQEIAARNKDVIFELTQTLMMAQHEEKIIPKGLLVPRKISTKIVVNAVNARGQHVVRPMIKSLIKAISTGSVEPQDKVNIEAALPRLFQQILWASGMPVYNEDTQFKINEQSVGYGLWNYQDLTN